MTIHDPQAASLPPPVPAWKTAIAIIASIVLSGFGTLATFRLVDGSGFTGRPDLVVALALSAGPALAAFAVHALVARLDPLVEGLWGFASTMPGNWVAWYLIGVTDRAWVPTYLAGFLLASILRGATRAPLGLLVLPAIYVASGAAQLTAIWLNLTPAFAFVTTRFVTTIAVVVALAYLPPAAFTYRYSELERRAGTDQPKRPVT